MTRKFNPFTPNSPVYPGMFTGRTKEIDIIDRALYQTKNSNPLNLLLIGERGIGKTSLLGFAEDFAEGKLVMGEKYNFTVLKVILSENMTIVDLALSLKSSIERAWDEISPEAAIIRKTWDFLKQVEISTPVGGAKFNGVEQNSPESQIIDQFVYSLINSIRSFQSKGKDGMLILIDEADKASKVLNLGTFFKKLTETITSESVNNFMVILSGLPTLREVLFSSHESSLRIFQEMELAPLSPEDSSEVIRRGLEKSKEKEGVEVTIDKEALSFINVYSEGYPHFLQQVGFSVFEADVDNKITEEDVRVGFFKEGGALQMIGDRYYVQPFYNNINVDSQREILTIMAERWNDWISKEEIKTKFTGSSNFLTNGIRALKEKGIILPKPGAKGLYKLQWESFAFWIRAHNRKK